MRKIKENKAITLIALVITIIVLLILAGVSISAITSDDGILSRASDAKTQTVIGKEKDVLSMAYSSCQTDKLFEGDVTPEELKTKIEGYNENVEVTKSGKTLVVKYLDTGNEYKINQSGEIVDSSNSTQPIGAGIYAKLYSYNDGSGSLLEISSNPDYVTEKTGVTLKEDYGDINESGLIHEYENIIIPPWLSMIESYIYDANNIICVNIVDKIQPECTARWFGSLYELKTIENIYNLDTSKVVNMSGMFANCENLQNLDVSKFDTSNVTDMNWMFAFCSNLVELDVSNFNTANVINMESMFYGCRKLSKIDVSGFDTSKVTNMSGMFSGCRSVTELKIYGFDTSNVTTMEKMFSGCENLVELDVSSFDTSNAINMRDMFYECRSLSNIDVSGFDTSNATEIGWMFSYCDNLEKIDVSGFDTSNATNMYMMFYACPKLTEIDVSSFDTSNVTSMGLMFGKCPGLTSLDLSNFDTKNVEYMFQMFKESSNLTVIYVGENWVITQAETWEMFDGCGTSSVTLKTE